MANSISTICDILDFQRKLTIWYLKKIPIELLKERVNVNGVFLNAQLWIIGHLIWTDYFIGLHPLGYKGEAPKWIEFFGFGSSGILPDDLPTIADILKKLDEVHQEKLVFIRALDESILEEPYLVNQLGFKNNYYALLHLVRHEGVHTGGLATFCKLKGIKTV